MKKKENLDKTRHRAMFGNAEIVGLPNTPVALILSHFGNFNFDALPSPYYIRAIIYSLIFYSGFRHNFRLALLFLLSSTLPIFVLAQKSRPLGQVG